MHTYVYFSHAKCGRKKPVQQRRQQVRGEDELGHPILILTQSNLLHANRPVEEKITCQE